MVQQSSTDAVLADLAAEVGEEFLSYHKEAAPDMIRQAPELTAARFTGETFGTMVREHGAAIVALLVRPVPREAIHPAPYTGPFAQACARLGVSAAALLRSYQRGHELAWHWWFARIIEREFDAEVRAAVTARMVELLMAYISSTMALTAEVHAEETAQQTLGASWRRRNTVLEVVEGRARRSVAELSQLLGYDLQRSHLGFVVWGPDQPDDWSGLERAVQTWVTCATGCRALLVSVDGREVWGWVAGATSPTWGAGDSPKRGLRVAVGQPGRGLDGFRLTHREALLVRVLGNRVPGPVLRHAELATVALLRDDPDLWQRYVSTSLGGLAEPGGRERTLRETVREYLRSGESVRATGQALHLHRNTVQQRLDQAAKMRGRPLGEARLELAVALEILAHPGDGPHAN